MADLGLAGPRAWLGHIPGAQGPLGADGKFRVEHRLELLLIFRLYGGYLMLSQAVDGGVPAMLSGYGLGACDPP